MNRKAPGMITKLSTILFAAVIVIGMVWFYFCGSGSQSNPMLEGSGETEAGFTDTEQETKNTEPNLYTKLSAGEAVRIAIIGDTFGASEGADEGQEWDTQLGQILQDTYSSEVTIDNLSVRVTTAYQGYCTVMQNEWTDYDLAIVCYGSMDQNGDAETFQRDYEAIVRNLRNKNSNLVIMPMISTYVNDSDFSGTIRNIAEQYGLTCLNMNNAFVDSALDQSELLADEVYPTNTGYGIYAQAIADAIGQNIQSNAAVPEGAVKILYKGVRKMRKFEMIETSQLNELWEGAYTYTGEAKLLGICYLPASYGSDTISVEVNGEVVKTIDCVTSYDTDQLHYVIGAVDVAEDDTVTISVDGDSGVQFEGIVISG
jgi:lysophospholipase L1-like esterase